MTAIILDGKLIAAQLRKKITEKVSSISLPLQLAVILLGNNLASQIYVKNKQDACKEVNIQSTLYHLPQTTSEQELIELIEKLNQDATVHGILVQLPLPTHISGQLILEHIAIEKDVDGFHPYNVGRLAQKTPLLRPCTPFGIMHLLESYHITVSRKHAVIVGASNIVGKPLGLELLMAGATVTICHSLTENLEHHIRAADIVISATGAHDIISTTWLNKAQVIIDVGIHRNNEGKIHGDIDFEKAKKRVSAITPVPGGVGPMTIAMLLYNTLLAAGYRILD